MAKNGRGNKISPEMQRTIRRLRLRGLSFQEIADATGLSKATCGHYGGHTPVVIEDSDRAEAAVEQQAQEAEARDNCAACGGAVTALLTSTTVAPGEALCVRCAALENSDPFWVEETMERLKDGPVTSASQA